MRETAAGLGVSANAFKPRLGARAKQRLERTSDSVQQIALEIGFDDPLYFSRRFKHRVGVSPREYRERVPNRNHGEIIEGK